MRDVELLDLWTRAGRSAGPARAGVLAGASPDASVGAVNRALLSGWLDDFGERMECIAACPSCGERRRLISASLSSAWPAPSSVARWTWMSC